MRRTSFTVPANTSCSSPDPTTFTCAAANNLIQNWTMPSDYHGCTLGTNCHFEYCIAGSPPASLGSDGSIASAYCDWG
jgi:hypothetical protein